MSRAPWRWIEEEVALAIHGSQLAEHGGAGGLRDRPLLQSALARAPNLAAYGEPDAAALAAAYACGLARNHPFADANKRTAFVVALVFLLDNGFEFTGDDAEIVATMFAVAAGQMSERQLAAWLRKRTRLASR